jgi:hypothetical protein
VAEVLAPPAPLDKHHRVEDFESGAEELDLWLRQYGWTKHVSGNARVFVAARGEVVVGYYALATTGVEKADAPDAIKKGGVPAQIGCLLLARLAVTRKEHGRGLGRGLLVDAIRRSVRIAEDAGVRALLIHARDDEARQFSLHQAEFQESPTDPLHLFLHMKHARSLITSS